ncbi:MAG: META domain-containing protein [Bergeyella sp.]|nr:META domain-containing protein [Bergeyella sp.]
MKNFVFALLGVFLMASCAVNSSVKSGGKQLPLENTNWILVNEGIKENTKPTLLIEKEKVLGNLGCNNYFGSLKVNPSSGSFLVSGIGSTKMLCDDKKMWVENNFSDILSKVNRYVVSGDFLELYQNNLLLVKFKRQ